MNVANSDFSIEPEGDTLTEALRKVYSRLKALTSSQLIRPESFGAVANSAAAASANRNALQNWFNAAADGGILFQNPTDVYYVQARPSLGGNAATPLQIRYPVDMPILRLRSKFSTVGAEQRLIEFTSRLSAVQSYAMANQAVERGQYVWNLDSAPPQIPYGTEVLIQAGEDPYDANFNAIYLRARILFHDVNTQRILVDMPAPRAADVCISSPAPKFTFVLSAADNSSIGLLEIDQTEHGATALDMPIMFNGCRDVQIQTILQRGVTGGLLAFDVGARNNWIERVQGEAKYTAPSGSCVVRSTRDNNNRIGVLNAAAINPGVLVDKLQFSGNLSIGQVNYQNIDTSNSLWNDTDLAIFRAQRNADTLSIGSVKVSSNLDCLGNGARTGIVLARSMDDAQHVEIKSVYFNKDFYRLGCKPTYLKTKRLEGNRIQLEKEVKTPARNAGAVGIQTEWLGSLYVDEFRFKGDNDIQADYTQYVLQGFIIAVHGAQYNAAGSQTDALIWRYGTASSDANKIPAPAKVWVDWQLAERDVSNVADVAFYNYSADGLDRFVRFDIPAVFPARKYQFSYSGYPIRQTYVADQT